MKPKAAKVKQEAPKKRHNSKTPRSLKFSQSEDAEDQQIPSKFRRFVKHNEKPKAVPIAVKKKVKVTALISTEAKLKTLQSEIARAGRLKTKKYSKRQTYLDSKKKVEVSDRGQIVEKRLVDVVKFGEQVMEPPKITAIPRKIGYIRGEKPPVKILPAVTAQIEKKEEIKRSDGKEGKVGRTKKLRDMDENEKRSLLEERERMIELYRKNKQQRESGQRRKPITSVE